MSTTLPVITDPKAEPKYADTPWQRWIEGMLYEPRDAVFVRTALISNRPDYTLQAASPANAPRRPAAGPLLQSDQRDLRNLLRPATGQAQPALGAYEHR